MRAGGLVVAAVLAIAACGGGSSKDASPNSNSNSNSNASTNAGGKRTDSTTACKVVTQADASKLFGVEAKEGDNASPGNESSVCVWEADDDADHGYLLQVRVYDDVFHYGEDFMDGAVKVAGLGDKAFVSAKDTIAGTDVQFVKDGKTFAVNYGITNVMAKVKKQASDQADDLVAIVKANAGNV
jgi:hypothetical protein